MDFDDDNKDVGELGVGYSVIVLYELEFYSKFIKKVLGEVLIY